MLLRVCVVPAVGTQKDCICVDSSWEKMLPAAHIDLHLQTQTRFSVSDQRSTCTEHQHMKCCFKLLHTSHHLKVLIH